jgi:NAD(P)H-flavin reductase
MKAAVPSAMVPCRYRVRRRLRETTDTTTLELEPLDDRHLAPYAPGQFSMIYAFGVGEVPISMSGNCNRQPLLAHTVRGVGAVTGLLERMVRGTAVGVRGPFGRPWPLRTAEGRDVLVIAGGLGMAPLRPVVYHLMAQRGRYGRVCLLYGARTPADLLYKRELERWRTRAQLDLVVTVDRADGTWRGNVGVVTSAIAKCPVDWSHAIAMICGPEVMMRFTVLELLKQGVGSSGVYLSMERNMKCAVGCCGHCQFGPFFVCRDGPVFRYHDIREAMSLREA